MIAIFSLFIGERSSAPKGGRKRREDPQVGLRDVEEEALDPVQPGRVRQLDPGEEDVREQDEDVHEDEHVHKVLADAVSSIQELCARVHPRVRSSTRSRTPPWVKLPYLPLAEPDPRFLFDVSEPYLRIFRRFLPPFGALDLSPMKSEKMAIIGERSSAPKGGRKRRKIRR